MERYNMTLGEKLKTTRKSVGLTQEQLAEKLMVSRQAVTKWESDKGIPDIENIKRISELLQVSIDYLLNNGSDSEKSVIRESISLPDKKKELAKKKIVLEKYPDAQIWALIPKQKLTKSEKIIDNLLGFFTDAPFGVPELINDVKHMNTQYYYVEKTNQNIFVVITDEFIESREMIQKVNGKYFEMGEMKYTKCGRPLKRGK